MRNFYAACDLGPETGRVLLGTLEQGKLTLSEVRRFPNLPLEEKGSLEWNIPQLYQEIVAGLAAIGTYEEAVESVSCHSWGADYLLFDSEGMLVTPTYHPLDPRTKDVMEKVCSKVPRETIYSETGLQSSATNTLFQLGAEKSRRLTRAAHLLPVGDAFNFLLSGVPRVEASLASTTQLYNPASRTWSHRLISALSLPAHMFPALVSAGTPLGPLRPEIGMKTSLEDTRVVASCSHQTAAALAALPINDGEHWGYLQLGAWTLLGTELPEPIINDSGRRANFSNETGYGGSARFFKQIAGLWILEECRRFWKAQDREIDDELLTHLAGAAPAFESLIDVADPRFATAGDMPTKIQAFCRESNQRVPRKPGPIIRGVLESLALHYRKTLDEIESFTGRQIKRVFLIGNTRNALLNHFIANAVQRPVVVASTDAAAIGNVIVQALALGHLDSLESARELVRNSFKMETLIPYATAWNAAHSRLANLPAA
jgi:rhamnulokinase